MPNIHYKTCWILAIFFTIGCITFSGCAARTNTATPNQNTNVKATFKSLNRNPSIEQLISAPDPYLGMSVEVSGEVYNIVNYEKSITVGISEEKIAEFLECEFLKATSPPADLKEGQRIIVIGKVDVIKDVTFLRNCRVKNSE